MLEAYIWLNNPNIGFFLTDLNMNNNRRGACKL